MIQVECKVHVYEIDGQEQTASDCSLTVHSHWNDNDMVVVEKQGKKYTVLARDLIAAIKNATNNARF